MSVTFTKQTPGGATVSGREKSEPTRPSDAKSPAKETKGAKPAAAVDVAVPGPAATVNAAQTTAAQIRASERGDFPRHIAGEGIFYTVVGTPHGASEGLISEDGQVEFPGGMLEPFLSIDGKVQGWNDAQASQTLENSSLPVPTVTWKTQPVTLGVTAFARNHGEQGDVMYVRYRLKNDSDKPTEAKLLVAVRPFQVNPPWQTINQGGNVSPVPSHAPIFSLEQKGEAIAVNGQPGLVPLTRPERFVALDNSQAQVPALVRQGQLPASAAVRDAAGLASGLLEYPVSLAPGEEKEVYLAAPFSPARAQPSALASQQGPQVYAQTVGDWQKQLEVPGIRGPEGVEHLAGLVKANLGYMYINSDGPALKPGSRFYDRTWLRDGSGMVASMLRLGHTQAARDFIEYFAKYQEKDGYMPSVVDARGVDPIVQHDAHGSLIYAIAEYYRFTKDEDFVRANWRHVKKAVEYIQNTVEKDGEYKGLMPKSASHEGYISRPVHAYWDDWMTSRGLKDAAELSALVPGEDPAKYRAISTTFDQALRGSIDSTIARYNLGYIPAAVENADHDPPAVSLGVSLAGADMPKDVLEQTYRNFVAQVKARRSAKIPEFARGPYELRTIESLVRLGMRDEALTLLDHLVSDTRPYGWKQFTEIIYNNPRNPDYIGDMPHSWLGAELVRAVRSLFTYEDEKAQGLTLGAGVPSKWLEGEGISIDKLPTWYGELSYGLKSESPGKLALTLSGNLPDAPGGLTVKAPPGQSVASVSYQGQAVPFESGPDGARISREALAALRGKGGQENGPKYLTSAQPSAPGLDSTVRPFSTEPPGDEVVQKFQGAGSAVTWEQLAGAHRRNPDDAKNAGRLMEGIEAAQVKQVERHLDPDVLGRITWDWLPGVTHLYRAAPQLDELVRLVGREALNEGFRNTPRVINPAFAPKLAASLTKLGPELGARFAALTDGVGGAAKASETYAKNPEGTLLLLEKLDSATGGATLRRMATLLGGGDLESGQAALREGLEHFGIVPMLPHVASLETLVKRYGAAPVAEMFRFDAERLVPVLERLSATEQPGRALDQLDALIGKDNVAAFLRNRPKVGFLSQVLKALEPLQRFKAEKGLSAERMNDFIQQQWIALERLARNNWEGLELLTP